MTLHVHKQQQKKGKLNTPCILYDDEQKKNTISSLCIKKDINRIHSGNIRALSVTI